MANRSNPSIRGVDRVDGDAVIVDFSDDTSVTLTLDEILTLRPVRQAGERGSDALDVAGASSDPNDKVDG